MQSTVYNYINYSANANDLLICYDCFFLAGSNSSVLFSHASTPTSSNGIGNQLTNITNTSGNPVALNSTHAPTTHRLTTAPVNLTQPGIIPVNTGKSSSAGVPPTGGEKGVLSKQPKSTKPVNVVVVSSPANQSDDEGMKKEVLKKQCVYHRFRNTLLKQGKVEYIFVYTELRGSAFHL